MALWSVRRGRPRALLVVAGFVLSVATLLSPAAADLHLCAFPPLSSAGASQPCAFSPPSWPQPTPEECILMVQTGICLPFASSTRSAIVTPGGLGGKNGSFVVDVFSDARCQQVLGTVTATLPGSCEGINDTLSVKLFSDPSAAECPLCDPSAVTSPVEPPKAYWVCGYAAAGCSPTARKVCVQPPVNGTCANLRLPIDDVRTFGLLIRHPTESGGKPRVAMLTPKYNAVPDCVLPLFYTRWDYIRDFSVGDCLHFDFPVQRVQNTPMEELWLSFHDPDCPDCADHAIPVTGFEGAHCAGQSLAECEADRACFWSATRGVGCIDPGLLLLGQSSPTTCPVFLPDYCPFMAHLCRLNENDVCVALPPEGDPEENRFTEEELYGIWSASTINDKSLVFYDVAPDALTFNATMRMAHPCDVFSFFERRNGLQFRGWEHMQLTSGPRCSMVDETDRVQFLAWNAPLADHEIDQEGDETGGTTGQRFLFAPVMDLIDTPPNELNIALSVGTNGASVYGFNIAHNIARALLVWESDKPLLWVFVGVAIFDKELRLYINEVAVKTMPIPQGTVYRICAQDVGWSPFGGYVGILESTYFHRPSPAGVGGGFVEGLDFDPCGVVMDSFVVTAKGPFVSQPATIRDISSRGELRIVDLDPNTVRFSIQNAPPGVFLIPKSGVLFGMLPEPGSFRVRVGATTADPSCDPNAVNVDIIVLPAVDASATFQALDLSATAGSFYDSGIPARPTGGSNEYTFFYDPVPSGLSFDPMTGRLFGVPLAQGNVVITATVFDSNSGRDTAKLNFTVHQELALQGQPHWATEGSFFSRQPSEFIGGLPPFSYSLLVDGQASNSALGLALDTATGFLEGIPVRSTDRRARRDGEQVQIQLTLAVRDSQGSVANEQIQLSIAPLLMVETNAQSARLQVGQNVSSMAPVFATASGGRGPYTFGLKDGPPGIGVSAKGILVGEPTTAGSHTFHFIAYDANNAQALSQPVTMQVEPNDLDSGISVGAIVGLVLAAFVLFVVVAAGMLLLRRRKTKPYNFEREIGLLKQKAYFDSAIVTPRELNPKYIDQFKELGAGAYGCVSLATMRLKNAPPILVAVKQLIDDTADARDELLQESLLMAQVSHPHVSGIVGVVTRSEPMMIVLPYMQHGCLLVYLRKSRDIRDITPFARLLIAHDICSGMAFLEAHKIVHRDLAARNVLVDASHRCVVSDFGRARHLNDSEYYRSRLNVLPVRWMAPEALKQQLYTTKSDVFSYAVTLTEVWTDGGLPWAGRNVKQVLVAVQNGERMRRPMTMPPGISAIVAQGWLQDQCDRPSFAQILRKIQKMIKHARHDGLKVVTGSHL